MSNTEFPDTGKIQSSFFKELVFPLTGAKRQEVIVGPQYGVDVSIVQLSNGLAMALTSDPLSLVPTLGLRESAWLSVQLMANDMATTGLGPQYGQFILNLPPTLSVADFDQYWKYIHEFCVRLGIAITGGHTGRFEGQNSTVAGGGTLISIGPAEQMITSKGAQPGDIILMTKTSALVATSILAMSFPETVARELGRDIQQEAATLFYETSAVEAGIAMGELNRHVPCITAMHDVTEGGIVGAVYELSQASECGVILHRDKINIGKPQQLVAGLFEIDPVHCVGAGSMIITAKADRAHHVIEVLTKKGILATVIGEVRKQSEGILLSSRNVTNALEHPGADPYWAAFNKAWHEGLK
jgi:hydrogenase expression/formation protein HypE